MGASGHENLCRGTTVQGSPERKPMLLGFPLPGVLSTLPMAATAQQVWENRTGGP